MNIKQLHYDALRHASTYNYNAFVDEHTGESVAYVLEYPELFERGPHAGEALRNLVLAKVKATLVAGRSPPPALHVESQPHLKAWVLVPDIWRVSRLIPELVAGHSADEARYFFLRDFTHDTLPSGSLNWFTAFRSYRQPHLDQLLIRPGIIHNEVLRHRAGLSPRAAD